MCNVMFPLMSPSPSLKKKKKALWVVWCFPALMLESLYFLPILVSSKRSLCAPYSSGERWTETDGLLYYILYQDQFCMWLFAGFLTVSAPRTVQLLAAVQPKCWPTLAFLPDVSLCLVLSIHEYQWGFVFLVNVCGIVDVRVKKKNPISVRLCACLQCM